MEWWEISGIKQKTAVRIAAAEKKVAAQHHEINAIALHNQARVLKSFQLEQISEDCFHSSEGYGYHDLGREKLEALFARTFKGEDAMVRPHFVSGTHTLFTCLRGLLRPGERILSLTGQPYDTLSRAIMGPKKQNEVNNNSLGCESSLQEWNIIFTHVETEDLPRLEDKGELAALLQAPTRVVFIQRSRGYNPFRKSLTISDIACLSKIVRRYNNDAIILVDNCYGEFVEREEPLEGGADLIAGSLIKNPGGGLAPTGGYITGGMEHVSRISEAFSAPGLGKDLGAFIQSKRLYFQGLFMAPQLVAESLKGAVTIAAALEDAGYTVSPRFDDKRGDLVQSVQLKCQAELEIFCGAIQRSAPINAHYQPVAGVTAGYADPIYMAGGTFVQGSSSEFSADAPLREPYTLYIQGGLAYNHVILGLAYLLDTIIE